MDGFSFLFSLYSLLLGLAVAHVITGFADSWVDRASTAPGASTILLGLLILLRAAGQWTSFWEGRDSLTMDPWMVLICLGMALPYIFIGRVMFPRVDARYACADDYYMENRRALMTALLIPTCISFASNIAVQGAAFLQAPLFITVKYVLPLAIPLALIFAERPLWHRARLGVLTVCAVALMFP